MNKKLKGKISILLLFMMVMQILLPMNNSVEAKEITQYNIEEFTVKGEGSGVLKPGDELDVVFKASIQEKVDNNDKIIIDLPEALMFQGKRYNMDNGTCSVEGGKMICEFDNLDQGEEVSFGFNLRAKVKDQENKTGNIKEEISIGNSEKIYIEVDYDKNTGNETNGGNNTGKTGRNILKRGTHNFDDPDRIDWVVELNGDNTYERLIYTDTLGEGHRLKKDSIRIGLIDGDGTINVGLDDQLYVLGHSIEDNKFSLDLNTYERMVLIYYSTEIIDSSLESVSNEGKISANGDSEEVLENVELKGSAWSEEKLREKNGDLIITKVDDENIGLENAEFEIYDSEKNKVSIDGQSKFTSDKDGKIELKNLQGGTYYIKEVKAPEGYQLLDEEIEIKLNFNKIKVINKKIINYPEEPTVPVEPPVEEPTVPVEPPVEEPTVPVEPPVEEPTVPVEPPVEEPTLPVEPPVEEPTVPDEGISINPIVPPVGPIVPIEPEVPSIPEEEDETGVLPNIKRPEKDDEGVLGQLNERPIINEEEVNRPVYKEETSNPKTGDSGIFMYISLIVLGVIALMATKRKQTNN